MAERKVLVCSCRAPDFTRTKNKHEHGRGEVRGRRNGYGQERRDHPLRNTVQKSALVSRTRARSLFSARLSHNGKVANAEQGVFGETWSRAFRNCCTLLNFGTRSVVEKTRAEKRSHLFVKLERFTEHVFIASIYPRKYFGSTASPKKRRSPILIIAILMNQVLCSNVSTGGNRLLICRVGGVH